MGNFTDSIKNLPKFAKIAFIIAFMVPLLMLLFFFTYAYKNKDELSRMNLYLTVGRAVVDNWNELSQDSRKEITDFCDPLAELTRKMKKQQRTEKQPIPLD